MSHPSQIELCFIVLRIYLSWMIQVKFPDQKTSYCLYYFLPLKTENYLCLLSFLRLS